MTTSFARPVSLAKPNDIVARGSWCVTTGMGGWTHSTVHQTREEALSASYRPSEWFEVWHGDYALHQGGWVSEGEEGTLQWSDQWDPRDEWEGEDLEDDEECPEEEEVDDRDLDVEGWEERKRARLALEQEY